MEAAKAGNAQLRLRVFAGPNGSGKSTIVESVRNDRSAGRPLDFGIYINADDIAVALKQHKFTFSVYQVTPLENDLYEFAGTSGLLNKYFSSHQLKSSISFEENSIKLTNPTLLDRVAQLIARFLREELLKARRRFSFETVFSHDSNIDIMRRATEQGYKVYFYFVSTEFPEINAYRVELRTKKGGHSVPAKKIKERYYKSLDFLYEATNIAYQSYFFDNTINDQPFRLVAHCKKTENGLHWDETGEETANWFKKYYTDKVDSANP